MTVQQQWTSRPIQSFDGDHRGRHEDRFPLLLSNWYYYRSLRSLHFGHSATFFEGLYTVFVPPGPADLPVDQRFAAVADPRQTRRKSGAWRQGREQSQGCECQSRRQGSLLSEGDEAPGWRRNRHARPSPRLDADQARHCSILIEIICCHSWIIAYSKLSCEVIAMARIPVRLLACLALSTLFDATSFTSAVSQPARFLVPCKYPQGWNSTDASRDVNGTPAGFDHQCIVEYQPPGRILIPCGARDVFSSINAARDFYGWPVRVEYQCGGVSVH
jgi:hypothetical protein